MRKVSIRAKLVRLFTLQILLISVATVSGIYVTNTLVQDLLMRSALDGEAAHFWQLYANNPAQPVPNTDNLMGFLHSGPGSPERNIPAALLNADTDYGRIELGDRLPIFHASRQGDNTLYLLFDGDAVSDVAFLYGIAPLSLVLLVIYGLSFLAYRWSQQAVSPIVRLAKYIDSIDLNAKDQHRFELDVLRDPADAEVSSMIAAVESLGRRLDEFVERERLFTRDASHELRTPIAVFKGSLDLLERRQSLSDADGKILHRMRRSVEGMETLVETLLMLAREDGFVEPANAFDATALVQKQVEALQPLAENTNNTLSMTSDAKVIANGHPRVIEILTSNLISNALQFTQDGRVDVHITEKELAVTDTGIGMDEDTQARMFQPFFRGDPQMANGGYGLGLAIVRRLVDRCGWQLEVVSAKGRGTTIKVLFGAG
ncbi:MAG: HAMP domain-containing sensor histidine kinase [Pseudomonadota bacterium]